MKLDESRDVRVLWTRTKMAAEEKTVSVDAPDVKPSSQPPVPSTGVKKPEPSSEKKPGPTINVGVVKFAVKYLKFVGVALGIWFMGWLGLSYVWVLCGLMIFMIWRLNKDEKKKKRSSLQEAADNEDGAVSAKMEDLPAWVSFLNHETNFLVNTRQHNKKNSFTKSSTSYCGNISIDRVSYLRCLKSVYRHCFRKQSNLHSQLKCYFFYMLVLVRVS